MKTQEEIKELLQELKEDLNKLDQETYYLDKGWIEALKWVLQKTTKQKRKV